MKVLFVNTLYSPHHYGGAEISVQLLAEEHVRNGHECVVVATHGEKERKVTSINGVKVYYVPIANLYWVFAGKKHHTIQKLFWHLFDVYNKAMEAEILSILEEESPDIFCSHNIQGFSASCWSAAKQKHIPIVHTIRDHYLVCVRNTQQRRNEECTKSCLDCAWLSLPKVKHTKQVDAVIAVSNFMLKTHLEKNLFSNASVHGVIPPPLAPSRYAHARTPSLDGVPLRIGYMGRITPSKGIEVLLETLTRMKPKNWQLSIGGEGEKEYVDDLMKKYSSSKITFSGFVSPTEFLQSIDVLVAPSQYNEPAGRVALEAHAAGVPVISTGRGGIKEFIEPGKTGFLADDRQRLADAIEKFLTDRGLLKKMMPECLRNAEKYSVSAAAEKYYGIYEKVMSRK